MPLPLIQSYAKKAKVDVTKVEEIWERAKKQAEGIRRSAQRDRQFWALVNGITKKELGLREGLTLKEFDMINEFLKSDEFKDPQAPTKYEFKRGTKVYWRDGDNVYDGIVHDIQGDNIIVSVTAHPGMKKTLAKSKVVKVDHYETHA